MKYRCIRYHIYTYIYIYIMYICIYIYICDVYIQYGPHIRILTCGFPPFLPRVRLKHRVPRYAGWPPEGCTAGLKRLGGSKGAFGVSTVYSLHIPHSMGSSYLKFPNHLIVMPKRTTVLLMIGLVD